MTSFKLTENTLIVERDDGVLCSTIMPLYQQWLAGGGVPSAYDGKAAMLAKARELREIILNRLTGIQVNTADPQVVAAIQTARQSLLDFTANPAVVAAVTGAETKAAVMAYWYAVASALTAAAPTASSVFAGMGM